MQIQSSNELKVSTNAIPNNVVEPAEKRSIVPFESIYHVRYISFQAQPITRVICKIKKILEKKVLRLKFNKKNKARKSA